MEKQIVLSLEEYQELLTKIDSLEKIADSKPMIAIYPSWPRFGRMRFINPDDEMRNLGVSLNTLTAKLDSHVLTCTELKVELVREIRKNDNIKHHWLLKLFIEK
jgi:hypothetical protein